MKHVQQWLFSFLLFTATTGYAIKLPSVIGDHMVLQQQVKTRIWGWSAPGERITVKMGWSKKVSSAVTGPDARWQLELPAGKAGGPYEIVLQGHDTVTIHDVWLGEVWLCSGQSNMDMTVARENRYWCGVYNEAQEVANANYPQIRVFDAAFTPTDTVQENVAGQWELCSPATAGHFSAAAYFFARHLQQQLKVPIGLITTAYGASTAEAWTSRPALQSHAAFTKLLSDYVQRKAIYDTSFTARNKYKAARAQWETAAASARDAGKDAPREPKNPDPEEDQHSPAVLYNGMVAPLVPYTIRGALWYQGESNTNNPAIYRELMETLIADWRKAWHQGDFPFLYVQLANHGKKDTLPVNEKGEVLVRQAQLQNLRIVHTGMAVAIDNANPEDPQNIHPKNKQEIGLRLALLARALVYEGQIPYSGPLFQKMNIEDNKIRLHFDHTAGGLQAKGGALSGFAIAGADQQFVWANAQIEGNTVIVTSPQINKPVAVRYGWAPNPPVNLYNKAGLPASPFSAGP